MGELFRREPDHCLVLPPSSALLRYLICGPVLLISCSVSVNLLDDGTAVHLATVPGSQRYVELVERLMVTPPPPWHGNSIITIGITWVKYMLGITPSDTAIFAELVRELKTASEATLEKSLDGYVISITAPWQYFWRDQGSWSSDINKALIQNELQPWFPYEMDPVYLEEARTTLAACGRWLCEPFECVNSRENHDLSERIYYIR